MKFGKQLRTSVAIGALVLISVPGFAAVTYQGVSDQTASGTGTFTHSVGTVGDEAPLTIRGGYLGDPIQSYSVRENFSLDAPARVRIAGRPVTTSGGGATYHTANLTMQWFDAGGNAVSTQVLVSDANGVPLGDPLNDPPKSVYLETVLGAGDYYIALAGDSIGNNGGGYTMLVSEVPLPAAAILFGSALFGFSMFSTRRKV